MLMNEDGAKLNGVMLDQKNTHIYFRLQKIGNVMNNYIKSLATFLFNKINDYQNNSEVRKEKPMLWPAGIYFTEKNIEKWIEEHDKRK